MSFIAVSSGTTTAKVSNGPFWPDIDLAELRQAVRLDGTVTPERLQHAVVHAIIQTNKDLAAWQQQQVVAGYSMLSMVPADLVAGISTLVLLYQRAVYCATRANLLERYSDFDSTAKGSKDAAEQQQTITDLYRDARFAIRDILGVSHVTVALI